MEIKKLKNKKINDYSIFMVLRKDYEKNVKGKYPKKT